MFYFVVLIMICLSLYTGTSLYEHDKEYNISRDIYNYTDNSFDWNSSKLDIKRYDIRDYNNTLSNDVMHLRINNIVSSIANAFGFSMFESLKIFIELSYNSKGYFGLDFLLRVVKILLWVLIIGVLFYPTLVLGVLFYESFKYIKKHIIKRKLQKEVLKKQNAKI
jgi:hypothetical protein